MAGRILVPGWSRALDSDGDPIPAAISLFNEGTDALASVFSDEGLTTPLANPVQSNSAGRFPAIWASDANAYDWSVEAPYGPPGSPFTGTGLTTALAAEVLAADAAEAAADAAALSAGEASTDAATAASILSDIEDIVANAPDAPSVANKLNLNGGNVAGNAATLRSNIGAVGSVALAAGTGSSLVGFLQSGPDAVAETVTATLQRIIVMPEQFSGTDTQKVQAALNSAGDVAGGQNVARIVRLSRFYATTATLNVPAYVAIEGIGAGRSGIRPTMSSGPAIRASVANNTSSYLTEWKDFGIDGVNATGSAYAAEFVGQKITTLSRLRFSSFDTSQHAVQFLLGCQSIILDQCQFYANRLDERIGVPYVGTSFPTTIIHKGCIYEDGPSTGAETVLLQDSNGCQWINKCVFQSKNTPVIFRVTASANQQTAANHIWDSVYLEGNGASHSPSYTWKFEGLSGDTLQNCKIVNSDIHGASPTAHVHATYTDLLVALRDQNPSGHTWYIDGGNNTRLNYVWANQYQIQGLTFADVDGSNIRIWTGGGGVGQYYGTTENLGRNDTHRFIDAAGGTTQGTLTNAGFDITGTYKVNAVKVVGPRKTGWGAPTGTATRTTFDTATVTLPQLAERVKALLDDLNGTSGHGLIGT